MLFGGRCSLSFVVRCSLFNGIVCCSLFVECLLVVWCGLFLVCRVLFVVRRVRLLFAVYVVRCLLSGVSRMLSVVGVSLTVIFWCL